MDNRKVLSEKKNNVCYVDEDFFRKWSPEMAYILGFFAADGCLTINRRRGNKYIEFVSTDHEIIDKIKSTLKSNHKIGVRPKKDNWNTAYRLQIGSKKIYDDLVDLGFMPNKSKVLNFPQIPPGYLSHFVRGYFDGDGHCLFGIYKRKNRPSLNRIVFSGFTSGSNKFLQKLKIMLKRYAGIIGGSLCFSCNSFRLSFASNDSEKLYNFIYTDVDKSLYLSRKYIKFREALKKWGRSSVG